MTPSNGDADLTMVSRKKMARRVMKRANKYSATFAFDPTRGYVAWRTVAFALERTKKRWGWFAAAGENDIVNNTQLGTLSYLPREVRDMIMRELLQIYFEYFRFMPLNTPRPPIGCGTRNHWCENPRSLNGAYKDGCFHGCNQEITNIRAFSTLRDEFDKSYLAESILTFNRPEDLTLFLSTMSSMQLSCLQRIGIDLYRPYTYRYPHPSWLEWMRAFRGKPFVLDGLRVVEISVRYPDPNTKGYLWGDCDYPGEDRIVTEVDSIDSVLEALGVVTKLIKRSAPEVTFVIDQDTLDEEERLAVGKLLDDVGQQGGQE